LLIALSVMVVGPRFGQWLAGRVHLSGLFVLLWSFIHWTIAVGFMILAVEALYFLAPNIKQRLRATRPRAVVSAPFSRFQPRSAGCACRLSEGASMENSESAWDLIGIFGKKNQQKQQQPPK
jgi:hypothetical protein